MRVYAARFCTALVPYGHLPAKFWICCVIKAASMGRSSRSMARRLIFTRAVTRRIAPWVSEGVSASEIAARIGCTVGSLRVRCSQLGISLRCPDRRSPPSSQAIVKSRSRGASISPTQPRAQESLEVTLERRFVDEFQRSASSRGVSSAALAKALLQVIVQDSLYDAILDEGPHHGRRQARNLNH